MSDRLSALDAFRFTEELMSKAPVPGGGGAAALIGSLAAALGAMAANLTLGKKKYLSYEKTHLFVIAEMNVLRLRFLELIDEDAAAFEPLSRVYSLGKDSPNYEERLRAATLDACRAPFEMMQRCCDVVLLLEELYDKCSVLLLSDVGCAALAARCAMEAAAMNVFVNTRLLPKDPESEDFSRAASEMLRDFLPRSQAVSDAVMSHLRSQK
ncbi:MAG: cyclodeaminase/cyclohydrolase family protein [Oscillospiraceae bacterium]|nr:cyclodeaminase/cyclohydrolase family protein [Oscillospiraceae bacterium]